MYLCIQSTGCNNIAIHQPVKVMKQKKEEPININHYFCKITISRLNNTGPVTVGHTARKILGYVFYFLQEGGSITVSVADIHHQVLPIPEGWVRNSNIDALCPSHKTITDKVKEFVEKQLDLITHPFGFIHKNTTDSEEEHLEIEVDVDAEATETHPDNTVVDDGVPNLILTG